MVPRVKRGGARGGIVKNMWKCFGASVRGKGHIRAGIPNQDSFRISNLKWGDVAVVSDGVGSCPHAAEGSFAACKAIVYEAKKYHKNKEGINAFLSNAHKIWAGCISPFKPNESSATCLFAIRPNGESILAGMLGDGMISVLKTDGSYAELVEDKDGYFSNQTAALSESTQPCQWKTLLLPSSECRAILLCTDGVADDIDPDKKLGFIRHIYTQARKCAPPSTASKELRKMLKNWPVPKHSDDKTLVCLYKSGKNDEEE